MRNQARYVPSLWTLAVMAGIICLCIICLCILPATAPAFEAMPVVSPAGNCYRCHSPSAHPMENCGGCHDEGKYEPAATLSGGHGGLIVSDSAKPYSTAPVGSCLVCHTYTNECQNCHPSFFSGYPPSPPPALIPDPNPNWPPGYTHDATRIDRWVGMDNTYSCEMCHIQTWWQNIPQHNDTFGSEATHLTSTSGCGSCHSTALTTEHYRYVSPAGQHLDCFTCHSNSSLPVRQAVNSGASGCGACHARLHNVNVVPEIRSGIPLDVLQYPGLHWSAPIPLSIWQGEPWVEGNPADFRVIISNRAPLCAAQVWTYYRDNLLSRGWTPLPPEPAPGVSNFQATFVKDTGKLTVWFYGSESPAGSGSIPAGSRVEVIFNG